MPANPFLDPDSFRNRSDNCSENRLPPIWMASTIMLIGEHPVVYITIATAVSPPSECFRKNRMDGHRLLGCFRLASADLAISDRARHIHCALGKIDVTPLERKQFTLAQSRGGCQE